MGLDWTVYTKQGLTTALKYSIKNWSNADRKEEYINKIKNMNMQELYNKYSKCWSKLRKNNLYQREKEYFNILEKEEFYYQRKGTTIGAIFKLMQLGVELKIVDDDGYFCNYELEYEILEKEELIRDLKSINNFLKTDSQTKIEKEIINLRKKQKLIEDFKEMLEFILENGLYTEDWWNDTFYIYSSY